MTKHQTLIQQLIGGVLFLAVVAMLGWLSVRYKTEIDWTAGNRNTITEASRKQLDAMPGPVRFYVFAPSGAQARHAVDADIGKYKRFKPDIEVEFIDPSAQPQRVREFNISFVGEVVVEYQGRRENLRATTEQAITGTLQRLAFSGEQWVVFLEGHGERSTGETQQPDGIGRFAQALRDKGLKVQSLNLIKSPRVPDNTSVLVLASPERQPLEGEVKLIQEFVAQGGNLLWLADPDFPAGLAPLAQALGVTWQDGFAILPEYQLLGLNHPGFFAAVSYPPNPVTTGLEQLITVFPLVRSLKTAADSGWTAQPMLQTSETAWLETGPITEGRVALDESDIPGPLDIGVTLTRAHKPAAQAEATETAEGEPPAEIAEQTETRTQRVALVGDADFLSNAYLGELGNQQLGLNLVQWLASRDAQLSIDVPKAPDVSLYLPGWGMMLIAGGFIVALPLGLIGFGVARWVLRRRR